MINVRERQKGSNECNGKEDAQGILDYCIN